MKEIESISDIELLVNTFYAKVMEDELLAPFFKNINFDKHLPKMNAFWAFVLLDQAGYSTDVTQKHINMPLNQGLFNQWVKLFSETLDELFIGEKVELAKQRAFFIAWTIQSKIDAKGKSIFCLKMNLCRFHIQAY